MSQDAVWKAFTETGEPVYYLLYRAMAAEKRDNDTHARGPAAG